MLGPGPVHDYLSAMYQPPLSFSPVHRRWSRRLALLWWICCLWFAGCTSPPPPETPTAPDPAVGTPPSVPASEKELLHFLWRVTSDTTEVFLLGSVHVARADLYPLDEVIEKSFEASEVLVTEVPMTPGAEEAAAQSLVQAALYPQGDALQQHISAKTLELLTAHLVQSGGNLAGLSRLRPWFVSIALTMGELAQLKYDPRAGIDQHFVRSAMKLEKETGALETIGEQVAIFANLSDALQELMLRQTLEELDELGPTMQTVFEAWLAGNADLLSETLMAGMKQPEYAELHRTMFLERNVRMADKIEAYLMGTKKHFVVVGSGHLIGEGGIVDLLQKAGHTPTQL